MKSADGQRLSPDGCPYLHLGVPMSPPPPQGRGERQISYSAPQKLQETLNEAAT